MLSTIENKLTVGFLVVVLASFLIAGGVGAYLFNDFIQTNIQDDVVHDLDVADAIFQNHLVQIENMISQNSVSSRIRNSLLDNDSAMLRQNLDDIYHEKFSDELDILTVTDNNGIVVARARNPALFGDSMADNDLISHALTDMTVSSIEIMTREELLKENRSLADQAYMEFTSTPKAKPRPEDNSTSGMVLIAAAPIHDDDGNVIGVLYGADLINRDYKIVDEIKNALYKDKIYNDRDMGTTTIFQEDFRISTNVPTDTGERAITTRVSQEVNEAVLEGGEYWKDRAFVVNTWYVTAYKPIKNFDGEIIGILYVGILEQPYIDAGLRILGIYLLYLLSGFVLSMFIAHYYSKIITQPINKLIKGTEAIPKGEFEEIDVGTKDEIGKLADSFNVMAKDLQRTMGELISSKNEVETIFKSISDVASAQDMDMRIIFTNELAKEIYGEDVVGNFCYQVYEGRNEICEDCPAIKSLETGEVMRLVHSQMDKDGMEHFYEITGSPLKDEYKRIIGTLAIRRDVTEQKRSNELKDLFTDILRHDLLNPAGIVKGYAEVLLNMEEDEKKIRALQTIERNNEKMINMIEIAAKFAKLETVEELEFEEMDIGAIFKGVVENFRPKLNEKQMILEFAAEGIYPANVNPVIEEVFANLLSNAIKYCPVESKIIIDILDSGEEWKVTVTDFGEGISDEDKPKVFTRFKRVGKGSVKGTGLGLAIVKKIIVLHGGSVGIEDNPEGRGSVFWVTVKKACEQFQNF